jgi:hypothetical protein
LQDNVHIFKLSPLLISFLLHLYLRLGTNLDLLLFCILCRKSSKTMSLPSFYDLFPRRAVRTLTLFLLLLCTLPALRSAAQYDDDYVSYDDFYQSLAPFGQWIEDPEYGYVWSPGEDDNFIPYCTNGHWVMTEYGNTWVSDYQWGWACFHYGRWTYNDFYGWLWIPGENWGPAWVSWRYGEGFYGWAPLGPDYRTGTSIMSYNCPGDWWVFIPPQYIYSGRYYQYWQGPSGNRRILSNTYIINNTSEYNNTLCITGPHISQVRQVTGNPVQVFKIRNSRNRHTRVHNDVVRMYRPAQITPASRATGERTVPPDVVTAPRAVTPPQEVGTRASATPPFRTMVINRQTERAATPGTNINQTAEPQRPTQRTGSNPYEWDVSRSVKQEYTPPVRQAPAPRPTPPPRTAPTRTVTPTPKPQPGRQQPSAPSGTKPSSDPQPRQGGRR